MTVAEEARKREKALSIQNDPFFIDTSKAPGAKTKYGVKPVDPLPRIKALKLWVVDGLQPEEAVKKAKLDMGALKSARHVLGVAKGVVTRLLNQEAGKKEKPFAALCKEHGLPISDAREGGE